MPQIQSADSSSFLTFWKTLLAIAFRPDKLAQRVNQGIGDFTNPTDFLVENIGIFFAVYIVKLLIYFEFGTAQVPMPRDPMEEWLIFFFAILLSWTLCSFSLHYVMHVFGSCRRLSLTFNALAYVGGFNAFLLAVCLYMNWIVIQIPINAPPPESETDWTPLVVLGIWATSVGIIVQKFVHTLSWWKILFAFVLWTTILVLTGLLLIWVWLLCDDGPSTRWMKSFLVLLNMKGPVAIKISA